MYDFMLGGKDNYASDRDAIAKLLEKFPDGAKRARANRAFLGRAVRYVAGHGIRQFLDLGAGLPTRENVHQVAQAAAPDARTVYVDNDPLVLVHAKALLSTDPLTAVVQGDVRNPAAILSDPHTTALLDLTEPVCVLLVAVLHFLRDTEDPAGVVAILRDAMVPGSYLILSHATRDGAPPQELASAGHGAAIYNHASAPFVVRDATEVGGMLAGFSLVSPGLVHVSQWRPDAPSGLGYDSVLGAVARKDWRQQGERLAATAGPTPARALSGLADLALCVFGPDGETDVALLTARCTA